VHRRVAAAPQGPGTPWPLRSESSASRSDHDLKHRRQAARARLDPRCDERFPTVREEDDVAGLEVRSRMLDLAEIVTGVVVNAVDGHAHQANATGTRREAAAA
jgi:hypothetical protein